MLQRNTRLHDSLRHAHDALNGIDLEALDRLVTDLLLARERGHLVFLCGNGGSGANASHMAQDLAKGTLRENEVGDSSVRRLRTISLTDNTPLLLAWANDVGFDRIFVEQLQNLASANDLLIAISGSGNSRNVLEAVDWANSHGMITWGLVGCDGGMLRERAQKQISVSSTDMGTIESVHLLVLHWILNEVRERGRC